MVSAVGVADGVESTLCFTAGGSQHKLKDLRDVRKYGYFQRVAG